MDQGNNQDQSLVDGNGTAVVEKNESTNSDLEKSGEPSSADGQENQLDPTKVEYVDGKCYYTDPNTGTKLEWNDAEKKWAPVEDFSKNYEMKDGCYHYTDQITGVRYKWNTENNNWDVTSADVQQHVDDGESEEEFDEDDDNAPKKKKNVARQDMSGGIYGMDGDQRTYTDSKDGTVYVWDTQKHAWFPKVDDDFLAQYQMNYGFGDSTDKPSADKVEVKLPAEPKPPAPAEPTLKRKLPPEPPTWFDVDEKSNTKVYVSNLPLDITEQEFLDLMQKCGLVMKDLETGKMKIKLYTDPGTNNLKGDGLCTYIKVESVQLALNLLDGCDFKGKTIKVERAKFTMKGSSYDPALKPKKKKKKALEKIKKMQEKLFDWRPGQMRGERAKHERTVILKNLFEPATFDKDVSLILEYQEDLREECIKCGEIRKVIIHDRHPEGVAQIIFKEAEAADACVQLLNGRWFGQRKIEASTWDGKTKYKIHETEEEIEARINKWDAYLEAEEERKERLAQEESNKGKEKGVAAEDNSSKDSALSPVTRGIVDDDSARNTPNADSDNDTPSSAGSGNETE